MSMTKEEAAAIVENEIGDSMESRAKLLCASRTILNALEASERDQKEIGELLAVIHRDGGHCQNEHGTAEACKKALEIIEASERRVKELEAAIREIVNNAPACGHDGQLYFAHFDEVGNEIGIENVDPVGCVGWMVSRAQAALVAACREVGK